MTDTVSVIFFVPIGTFDSVDGRLEILGLFNKDVVLYVILK